jgi:phosphatidylserine/phosphatidylglycerophosphate/cardiolipin synthase-like enzyme
MDRPILDPLNTAPPSTLIGRLIFLHPDKLNTVRLMHDPPEPDFNRWFDTSPGMPVLTHGNQIKFLVRGLETMAEMSDVIHSSFDQTALARFVYLLGWSFDGTVNMGGGTTAMQLLTDAAKNLVEVRAMLWGNHKGATPPSTLPAVEQIKALQNAFAICDNKVLSLRFSQMTRQAAPNINGVFLGNTRVWAGSLLFQAAAGVWDVGLTGSHHHKILIVNSKDGLTAFCGGVDLVRDRLDGLDGEPKWNKDLKIFEPDPAFKGLHDVHCRVRGPAASEILRIFTQRWRDHADGKNVPLAAMQTPFSPSQVPVGKEHVQIGRTIPKGVHDDPNMRNGEQTAKSILLNAIKQAKTFIYMEDQYLVNMEISDALKAAIGQSSFKFLLILITSDNMIVGEQLGLPPPHRANFIENLKNAPGGEKVFVFQRWNRYIHAKLYIIDDKFAIIGTANCNRRSMEHDSEATVAFYEESSGAEQAWHLARRLRVRLWADHLSSDETQNMASNTDEEYAEMADAPAAVAQWLNCPPTVHFAPYAVNHVADAAAMTTWATGTPTPQLQAAVWDEIIDPGSPL